MLAFNFRGPGGGLNDEKEICLIAFIFEEESMGNGITEKHYSK